MTASAKPPAGDPLERDAVVVCLVCRVDFDDFPDRAEAGYFAGIHNDLHHGGHPVAFLAPVHAWVPDLLADSPIRGNGGAW